MSLEKVILDLADQMESDSESVADPNQLKRILWGNAIALRTMARVVTGETERTEMLTQLVHENNNLITKIGARILADNVAAVEPGSHADFVRSANDRLARVEKNRVLREQEEKARVQETHGPRMAVVVDGPSAGVIVPIAGGMPVGARTEIAGRVYQLRQDGRLHIDEAPLVGG